MSSFNKKNRSCSHPSWLELIVLSRTLEGVLFEEKFKKNPHEQLQ
ncbi:unnamed protein product [Larinioides sclopetarius]|uniref:Uncharacterized protein n=1 Tax=Larinioides sclopetarius TaxID=280406 RepID=A0AAV2AQV5_9ARAC